MIDVKPFETDENISDISVEYSNSQNQLLNLGVTDFNSKYILHELFIFLV